MESVEVGGKNSTGKNSPDAIEKSRSNSDSVADTSSNGFTNNFASISTIQNIYDGKEIERDKSNLTRTNSFKSRISKTAYLQLHRQSSSTGVSTVDRLKGRYEDISKTTDNSTANTVVRSKIITFVSPEENLKTIDTKLQAKTNPNNLHRQEASQSNNERSPHITEPQPQTPEELLSKTKSNIEQLQKTLSTKLSTDTIAQLRNKYSPASFGYPKSILKTSIPKKVQFSEQISKIPIPTPRISIKSKDECDHTDNLEIKEVKGVIVKEISTTHTIPAQEPESNFKPPVHTKDENFNVIDTEAVIAKQLPSILNPSATFENARYKNNSVDLEEVRGIEIEVEYENITFAEPEDKHFIVRRSSSDDSIEKLESSLSEFIMEKKTKEKKRSNSFRKILTGGFFGRDKKKPSDNQQKKDQVVFSDNAQNESQVFERSSSHRHTVDNSCSRQQVQKNAFEPKKSPGPLYYYSPSTKFQRTNEGDSYTEMNNSAPFVSNRPPKYSPEHYLPMDNSHATTQPDTSLNYNGVNKYFDTSSSSSNTIDYDSRNSTYQNALIAQAEMRQIREAENSNKNKPVRNRNDFTESRTDSPENRSVSPELFRDSPVDSDTSKYVQLVKPKALIPINSERPLPNPYHNKYEKIKNTENYQNLELSQTLNRNLNLDNSKPYPQKSNLYNRSDRTINDSQVIVEDIYGTVFDSISPQKVGKVTPDGQRVHGVSPEQRSSLSPKSLEASKLKLPPNREKVDLQPRIRSPIPQTKVSTDKIIATELLRNKRSPTRTSPVTRDGGGRYSSPTRTSPIVRGGSGRYNSPTRPSSLQGSNIYENAFTFPDNANARMPENAQLVTSSNTKPNYSFRTPSNEYIDLSNGLPTKTKPPKPPTNENCVQAAEWHRKQRELDKSPAIEVTQQITTNAMVHAHPSEVCQSYSPSPLAIRQTNPIYSSTPNRYIHRPMSSPKSVNSSYNNLPQQVPIQQNSPSPKPEKQHILQDVEAFYWRELRKLKDKEEQDLFNYRQQQMQVYGYIEDPVLSRRSRSVSPSMQRGRRSLSLPRDVRQVQLPMKPPILGPEPIPEGRPVIAKRPITLPTEPDYVAIRQPLQRNPNFIRNTFERSTIGPIGMNVNYPAVENFRGYRQTTPIFKRGSLTGNINTPENPYQMGKKVSFSSNRNPDNSTSWPTKNGFTKSPPTRRVEREVSLDDDVFLPNTTVSNAANARAEELYIRRKNQGEQYRVTNQSVQSNGAQYGASSRQLQYVDRRDPVGLRQTVQPVYASTAPKTITVYNKECDIYGQIHDSGQKVAEDSPDYGYVRYQGQDETPYGVIRQSGLVYGQLQSPNSSNPVVLRQSHNQLNSPQQNFVRGTRLTASVNDMYRRYPAENVRYVDPRYNAEVRYSNERVLEGPQRPLPPVPERKDSRAISVRKIIRGYVPLSDNESGSEAGEVQRILRSGSKQKNFNVIGGGRGENEGEIKSGRSRSARREDPRRHTLTGDQHYSMAGQGGPLSRTMDLENFYFQGQFPRGYPPSSNAMLFDDDPGIMSEVETSSTGFRRGGKQRSSLPVVRTPSKTLERPLVFLQYRNETKRALLPNEITSIDTVKALFVRSFPKQLSMEYLDSPLVKIYIHDSSKDMFYELEDVRSHLREIRDRSVLRLFESTDVSGGLPMGGVGIPGGVGHFEDPSYFSEPEFDSEYQHQHIHKSKGSTGKGAPYYMGSTTSLPRSGPLLRPYSPAVGALPPDRIKPLPAGNGYMSSPERGSRGYEDPYYSQYTSRSGSITPVIDEEVSDTELLDEQYSLYGVKLGAGGPRGVRSQFPGPAAAPYDTTRANYNRLRVEHMERQLANLTGLVQKALTQTPTPRDFLAPPGRDAYRSDKSVSFEKSVSFSDEPPDMNSPKQHSPQHAEKDRLKPAPPPKPASLSPGQYDGRHIYRDLQLTPEMYNQLRGLQKKAKDLRAEVRNLRRMSQAQAHSVKETIRDTFIKIRAMLMAGGEQVWQAGMDQERVRLSRDEDLYKQEMIRLEKDLTDLEASVEELRGNVINRKTRVNMSDVENMALVLSKSSKTVADLKLRFPGLQDSMKAFLSSEMDKVVREEKFLKEEPERLESALRRCKKLTGTLVTLKRLASVQEQRLPCSTNSADGRISPTITETPPITPTSGQHSKPPSGARMGQVSFGGDNSNTADSNQRPENALDALLDELQTFSKPHSATVNTQMPQASYSDSTPSDPPAIPIKGIPPSHSAHFSHPHMSEIGRKGSMDSAVLLPTQNLTVTTATGSLRRLHSYPSGSDTDNSPPIQPLKSQLDGKSFTKPPIPERNVDLFQHISGRRVPPPPPPRTSSKSPLASPTSPSLPPRSPATGLQHIQNVQNMTEKPQSQFEAATQNLGLSTLRRNVPNRSSMKDNKAQTLPRNIGSNLQVHTQPTATGSELQNVSSSSCESVNSQDGTKKGSRKEELEQRHQELLKKQKALQEQYARLQQLQRGNNTLAVVPPAPDQLLKKTGSESNLLQKMGLQLSTTQMTGSLTHLPSNTANSTSIGNNITNSSTNVSTTQSISSKTVDTNTTDNNSNATTTSKVYETDIL